MFLEHYHLSVPLFLKVPLYNNCLSVFTLTYGTNIFIYTYIYYQLLYTLIFNIQCVDIYDICTFMGSSLLHHCRSLRFMYIPLEAPTGPMVSNLNFAQEQTSKNSWLRGRCDSMSYLGGGSRMKKKHYQKELAFPVFFIWII